MRRVCWYNTYGSTGDECLSYNIPCRQGSTSISVPAIVGIVVAVVSIAAVLVTLIIALDVGIENADACRTACGEGKVKTVTAFKCYCKD